MPLPYLKNLIDQTMPHIIPIGLNQRTFLTEKITALGFNGDDIWDKTEGMDMGKYKYLLALAFKGETEIIKQELSL